MKMRPRNIGVTKWQVEKTEAMYCKWQPKEVRNKAKKLGQVEKAEGLGKEEYNEQGVQAIIKEKSFS